MRLELYRDSEPEFPGATLELASGDLTVRTRKRGYLVAFAVQLHRSHAFIQAGDRILWIRQDGFWNLPGKDKE